MKLCGFTLPFGHDDIFVATSRKNKTSTLASEIRRALNIPEERISDEYLLFWVTRATYEERPLPNGRTMIEINKGGSGAIIDFVGDGCRTRLVHLDEEGGDEV